MYHPDCLTALVSDTHAAEVAYTPYQRPPDALALPTAIPRGLLSFVVRKAELAAKPLNDTMLLTANASLPAGFGYVLNELHANILQDQAGAFESEGILLIADSSKANTDFDYRIAFPFVNYSNNGTNLQARGSRIPAGILTRTPIVPETGTLVSLRLANLQAAAAATGTFNALISFWQFDRAQMQHFPIHSVVNTMTR